MRNALLLPAAFFLASAALAQPSPAERHDERNFEEIIRNAGA